MKLRKQTKQFTGHLFRNWHKYLLFVIVFSLIQDRDWKIGNPLKWMSMPDISQSEGESPWKIHKSTLEVGGFAFGHSAGKSENKPPQLLPMLETVDEGYKVAFINRFAGVAQNEQEKFGIPASVILASGLLHSFAGTREDLEDSQNYFLIPCTDDWKGDQTLVSGNCIRKYKTAWLSFRAYSELLKSPAFRSLTQNLGVEDIRGWCRALQQMGIYPEEKLEQKLLVIIERYRLSEFD